MILPLFSYVVTALYLATVGGLTIYALYVLILIGLYLRHRRDPAPPLPDIPPAAQPCVTVQVPLRNEPHVWQRILQAVAAFDWPADRLDIQILDDSDDETTALMQAEIARLQAQGTPIRLLHRARPTGYKAGALAEALPQARGEYVAIFDADFCPPADFLRRTVPYLAADPTLAMVQARWGHLNVDYSVVTRAQALLLDAHFTVEHIARNRSGLLMNFNGTAGVWRRSAILDAGGWRSDTVAEDLDLSYRAQLAGWRTLYLPDVVAPAELPPLVATYQQQQARWAKGAMQVFRKLARPIIVSPQLNWRQKGMALLHLNGYVTQPLLLLLVILTLPMTAYHPELPLAGAALSVASVVMPLLCFLGQVAHYRDWPQRIVYYPVLMFLGLGIAWSTTRGYLEGLQSWGGEFTRTPKFNLETNDRPQRKQIRPAGVPRMLPGEVGMMLYTVFTLWLACYLRQFGLIAFSLIYLGGALLVLGSKWPVLHFKTNWRDEQ